jgi:tetratricopeptide (TPR) repeat protein
MKNSILLLTAVASVFANLAQAQTFPLSSNSWSNPEFVERFLGSYGVLTEKEPQISSEEAELFQSIGEFLNANDYRGAMNALRGAAGPEASAAIEYTLANLLLQEGDYQQSIRQYEVAIRKFPNFLRAYKNSGLAYLQMQNYEKAAEFIVKSIELGNQEGDSFGLLGYCYLNMGMNQSALDAYRLAGVLSPSNKDWQVGKATALFRVGLFEESISSFDELIVKDPGVKGYYMQAANACLSLGEQLKAAHYLELLRRNQNTDSQVLMLLGDIYINQGLFSLARDVYTNVLDVASAADADRIFRFTRGLVSFGAYDDATSYIDVIKDSGLRLSSADSQRLLNLEAEIALATGDSEEAVASLEAVIETDPLNGDALLLLGNFYADSGDTETAIFYYERAEKIPDYRLEALIQHARVNVSQRKFADAIELLEMAQGIKEQSHIQNYLNAVRNALRASL